MRLNPPLVNLHYLPRHRHLTATAFASVSLVGSIALASEVSLPLLVPANPSRSIKCAKQIEVIAAKKAPAIKKPITKTVAKKSTTKKAATKVATKKTPAKKAMNKAGQEDCEEGCPTAEITVRKYGQ